MKKKFPPCALGDEKTPSFFPPLFSREEQNCCSLAISFTNCALKFSLLSEKIITVCFCNYSRNLDEEIVHHIYIYKFINYFLETG